MISKTLSPAFFSGLLFRLLTAPSLNFAVQSIDRIVNRHSMASYRLLHHAQMVAYAVYVVRFAFYSVAQLSTGNQAKADDGPPLQISLLAKCDVFDKFVDYFSAGKDRLFGFTLVSLFVFGLLETQLIYLSPVQKTISWLQFYSLVVLNARIFQQSKKSKKGRAQVWRRRMSEMRIEKLGKQHSSLASLAEPFDKFVPLVAILDDGKFHKRQQVLQAKLPFFPTLSYRTRSRLLLCIALGNCIGRSIITGLYGIFLFFVPYYYFTFFLTDSLLVNVLQLADILVFTYLIIAFIRLCALFIACALVTTTYVHCHFGELNCLLSDFPSKFRCSRSWQSARLRYYITEHITGSMIITRSNRGLWNRAMLVAVICQIPSNIHLISRVLLEPGALLLWYILAMQFGILIGICALVAGYTRTVHAGSRALPGVQGLLPRSSLPLKLKVLGIYEMLSSERKIGQSIGSIATITHSVMYQIFGAYIAYILILLKFFLT
ncbi:hypothetical protein TYRP_019438 [Tyrophagus putrescentiae]|nr:hypothetical protein TYRP_019438 [Tyrophagus putrescentiae]